MSTTPPLLRHCDARPYVAKPLSLAAADLPGVLAAAVTELLAWACANDIEVVSAPFVRFRSAAWSAPGATIDIDVGLPIARPLARLPPDDAPVRSGVLPPGIYASVIHTGPTDGLRVATAELLSWAEAHGVAWHRVDGSRGEQWEARIESYLTDPTVDPADTKRQTEIAILTKET